MNYINRKIKVIGNDTDRCHHYIPIGSIGYIRRISSTSGNYDCMFPGNFNKLYGQWISPKDLFIFPDKININIKIL